MSRLVFTHDATEALTALIDELKPATVHIVTDKNVARLFSMPLDATLTIIPPGDEGKTLNSVAMVWQSLSLNGATRHSLIVNIGGGMVTDLGGFAAATFKRGCRHVNIPTTVLGAVDAAVGGKTGFNFNGLKNEIGAFNDAEAVIVSPEWYATLPKREIRSGRAEMLKHALLTSTGALSAYFDNGINLDTLRESIMVKERIVTLDPTEGGIRKALNLGHTIGHALESLALERDKPVPHGYAVAWGLVTELVLSKLLMNFDSTQLHAVACHVKEMYGTPGITCDDYPRLLELMSHDKKNTVAGEINFTLLSAPGKIEIDNRCSEDDIKAALDITRDLLD